MTHQAAVAVLDAGGTAAEAGAAAKKALDDSGYECTPLPPLPHLLIYRPRLASFVLPAVGYPPHPNPTHTLHPTPPYPTPPFMASLRVQSAT